MKRISIAIIAATLAGCSTSGTKVDPATVATFKPGITTYDQVKAAIGEPTTVTLSQDGSRTVGYGYTQIRTNPATFIPVVGLFAGGADAHTETVAFTFGPDGVMRGK